MTSLSEYIRQQGSDAAVSAKVGLDRTTVSRIRRGIADPPLSTVHRIVSAFGGRVVIEPPAPEPARATA